LNRSLISGAKKILLNVAASSIDDISYDEAMEVLNYIQTYASYKDEDGMEHNADIIWGVSSKPLPDGVLEVVVVATGFSDDEIPESARMSVELEQDIEIEVVAPEVKPQQIVAPIQQNPASAAAVLERKPSRYDNIEKEMRVPSYVRRADVKLVTDNVANRKEVFNDDAAKSDDAGEAGLF
jgi:cell division protein FtsZ